MWSRLRHSGRGAGAHCEVVGDCPSPSPSSIIIILITEEAVAGPSGASSPDDLREPQALLRRVASNLGLEVEEMAEQSENLFNILVASSPSRVALPMHEGVIKIAISL